MYVDDIARCWQHDVKVSHAQKPLRQRMPLPPFFKASVVLIVLLVLRSLFSFPQRYDAKIEIALAAAVLLPLGYLVFCAVTQWQSSDAAEEYYDLNQRRTASLKKFLECKYGISTYGQISRLQSDVRDAIKSKDVRLNAIVGFISAAIIAMVASPIASSLFEASETPEQMNIAVMGCALLAIAIAMISFLIFSVVDTFSVYIPYTSGPLKELDGSLALLLLNMECDKEATDTQSAD